MSIMELDPPDYWFFDDNDGEPARWPMGRVWNVTALNGPYGQYLLARVDPPCDGVFVGGTREHPFVVFQARHRQLRLVPADPRPTEINLYYYLGAYRGQSTVWQEELEFGGWGWLISREEQARRINAEYAESGHVPSWVHREQRVPNSVAHPGCGLALALALAPLIASFVGRR